MHRVFAAVFIVSCAQPTRNPASTAKPCQVEQDIQAGAASSSAAAAQPQPPAGGPCSSLAEWFAAYGEPGPPTATGLTTTFEDSPKIYGGTSHHRGKLSQD